MLTGSRPVLVGMGVAGAIVEVDLVSLKSFAFWMGMLMDVRAVGCLLEKSWELYGASGGGAVSLHVHRRTSIRMIRG